MLRRLMFQLEQRMTLQMFGTFTNLVLDTALSTAYTAPHDDAALPHMHRIAGALFCAIRFAGFRWRKLRDMLASGKAGGLGSPEFKALLQKFFVADDAAADTAPSDRHFLGLCMGMELE